MPKDKGRKTSRNRAMHRGERGGSTENRKGSRSSSNNRK